MPELDPLVQFEYSPHFAFSLALLFILAGLWCGPYPSVLLHDLMLGCYFLVHPLVEFLLQPVALTVFHLSLVLSLSKSTSQTEALFLVCKPVAGLFYFEVRRGHGWVTPCAGGHSCQFGEQI